MLTYETRIIVCRGTEHDVGQRSYEEYLRVIRAIDLEMGKVFDWVKNHAYFSRNTAIVIRPEFGRDDEINRSGQLLTPRASIILTAWPVFFGDRIPLRVSTARL